MRDGVNQAATIACRLKGRLGDFRLDAAFEVPASGVTALFGPSGAGKTTLLRCIAGLERLQGRLVVAGKAWQSETAFVPAHRRPVGYVFQEPSLLAHLSVEGNLRYGLRRFRGEPAIDFDEAVELLGLASLIGRSTGKLSGGERQRVAIGRALLSQPQLLLMDEPLSSLDADSKSEILPFLERLHARLAVPVIYVSHDPAEVIRLADRLLLMRWGRIEPAPAGGSPLGELEASERLAGLDQERLRRLALAALMAGLEPSGVS